jgi:replication factor A1
LKPGTHGHNLYLKVASCNVVVEKTRTDNTKIRIAECLVGDKTGSIILTARNGIFSFNYSSYLIFLRIRFRSSISFTFIKHNTDSISTIDQIDLVQPGKSIIVRNAKIEMFNKGFMRLVVDKWGKIEPAKEPLNFEVNKDNNLSNVEYELVTVEDN